DPGGQAAGVSAETMERTPNGITTALRQLGRLRQRRNDHRAALLYLGKALELAPDLAPLNNEYGISLRQLGRLESALAAFARAAALDPNHTAALANLGETLLQANRPADAAKILDRLVSQEPDSLVGWTSLGKAALAQSDHKRAEQA